MSLLLLPGPLSTGPSAVEAARQPVELDPTTIYDAEGKGIGCRGGGKKYRGPGLPKDPPWPPGAAPTPSPEPSPTVEPSSEPANEDLPTEPPAEDTLPRFPRRAPHDVALARLDCQREPGQAVGDKVDP